jgi:acylphosphatase
VEGLGDFDNDGNIDVVINGFEGSNIRFKQYMNNGNGTFQAPRYIAYDEDGLYYGQTVTGDINNDGYLDIVANGQNSSSVYSLRAYFNDGTGTFKGPADLVPHAQATKSSVDLGDMDNDGDLDLVSGGYDNSGDQLFFLINTQSSLTAANTDPSAPSTLTSTFTFSSTGVSTATFKWLPASDSGTGATNVNGLSYDLQVSTSSNFARPWIIPGLSTGTSMWSSYLRPAKIFDGNTTHGVMLFSTKPWSGSDGAAYGLRIDFMYYFWVYTIDAGLGDGEPRT